MNVNKCERDIVESRSRFIKDCKWNYREWRLSFQVIFEYLKIQVKQRHKTNVITVCYISNICNSTFEKIFMELLLHNALYHVIEYITITKERGREKIKERMRKWKHQISLTKIRIAHNLLLNYSREDDKFIFISLAFNSFKLIFFLIFFIHLIHWN